MKPFKDAQGRDWELKINVYEAKRASDLLGVNVLQLAEGDPPLLTRLHADIIFLVDVLWAFCKPQAESRNVSEQQFAEAMSGDGLFNAHAALMGDLADFFRQVRRPEVAKLIELQRQIVAEGMRLATEKLEKIDVKAAVESTLSS